MYVNTYAEELIAHEGGYGFARPSHVAVCMAELVRRAGYSRACRRFNGEISLSRVLTNQGGYTAAGAYYGRGLPLFEIEFSHVEHDDILGGYRGPWWHTVRHVSRPELRSDLKRIFPNAKINR